jgi:hypothetical protein
VKIADLCLVGTVALSSGIAMGHGFHVDSKEIAAVLTTTFESTEASRDEVRKLRAESEKQHQLSKHHDLELIEQQAATRSTK